MNGVPAPRLRIAKRAAEVRRASPAIECKGVEGGRPNAYVEDSHGLEKRVVKFRALGMRNASEAYDVKHQNFTQWWAQTNLGIEDRRNRD
jgi:hypothetical protein